MEPTRGDLKILNRTLRELRYAFKVFQPYRRRPQSNRVRFRANRADSPSLSASRRAGSGYGWPWLDGYHRRWWRHYGSRTLGRRPRFVDGSKHSAAFEQSANPIIDGDPKLVTLKYFFTRKLMFVKECSAVICLPGGFGTLDETLEVLTLLQTASRR